MKHLVMLGGPQVRSVAVPNAARTPENAKFQVEVKQGDVYVTELDAGQGVKRHKLPTDPEVRAEFVASVHAHAFPQANFMQGLNRLIGALRHQAAPDEKAESLAVLQQTVHRAPMATQGPFRPGLDDAPYIVGSMPILGKHVPQHHFAVMKYDGTPSTRFMKTTGCLPCSKLTMYDPQTRTGMLVHVDAGEALVRTADALRTSLEAEGVDLSRLQVRHVQGEAYLPDTQKQGVRDLMQVLGMQSHQLIEEDAEMHAPRTHGIVFDLADGQTYEIDPEGFFSAERVEAQFPHLTPAEQALARKELKMMDQPLSEEAFISPTYLNIN